MLSVSYIIYATCHRVTTATRAAFPSGECKRANPHHTEPQAAPAPAPHQISADTPQTGRVGQDWVVLQGGGGEMSSMVYAPVPEGQHASCHRVLGCEVCVMAVNLSFAACGFLGIYQLGVVGALQRHGQRLLGGLHACGGASAGALVATVLLTAPHKLESCKDFAYRFAHSVRRQTLGAITPGYDFMLELKKGIEEILPCDAHQRAEDRLHVSITHSRTRRNHIVSKFSSREELIQALLASSFVPFYAGLKPVEFQGQTWIDGGFTDSLPIMPQGRTITVSPFSGPLDICPSHNGRTSLTLHLANMSVHFSRQNLLRLNQALFPPSESRMRALGQEGYEDAVHFLRREHWTSSAS
ncbi:hypothetical protein ACEWY4_016656 [Coilia grayii]|uniref:PNPLA domain-containing protein n=1 Tax=Coilia grayii TaxID=363190 RepID=A0ABD1JPC5_9TELE